MLDFVPEWWSFRSPWLYVAIASFIVWIFIRLKD